MNNRWVKKICAVLLTIACVTVTGCGQKQEGIDLSAAPENNEAGENVVYSEKVTDSPRLTIGYTFWDLPLEGWVTNQANQMKLAAEALGVDVIFNDDVSDFGAQGAVNACQRYADMGVDGIVVVNFSDESLIDIAKICDSKQIPFVQATRTINSQEVADIVEPDLNYVGRIHEDEYTAAYTLGRKLVEHGAKKILLVAPEHGDTAYETRAEALKDACEEPDVDVIDEVWGIEDDDDADDDIKALLERNPDADAIFSIRCGFMPYIREAQDALGYPNYLPMVGFDFDKASQEYFADGTLIAAAGGHQADIALSLIMLVNSIRGAYSESDYPLDVNYNMMLIDGEEQFEEYCKWCLGFEEDFDNRQVLNINDCRSLCVDYNPDANIENIRSIAHDTSLEDVKRRHAGLVE